MIFKNYLRYFDVLSLTPAGNLLERLRMKNWNFKTSFTHRWRCVPLIKNMTAQ